MKLERLAFLVALLTFLAHAGVYTLLSLAFSSPLEGGAEWTNSDLTRGVIPLSGGYIGVIIAFALRHRSHWPEEFETNAKSLYVTLALFGPIAFFGGAVIIAIGYHFYPERFGAGGEGLPDAVAALATVSAALQGPFIADLFGERGQSAPTEPE